VPSFATQWRRAPHRERPVRDGLASLPVIPAYSISKAAAFSWTQSLRRCWPGAVSACTRCSATVDTDMSRDLDIRRPHRPRRSEIFDGVAGRRGRIFPTDVAASGGMGGGAA